MNVIERECIKNDLNRIIAAWLDELNVEIDLPDTTENTATYMATAALSVLDALQDKKEEPTND